ncbi:MAG: DMT family transporter [Candidatus Cloacimonadaceae bacterium]
MPPFFMLQKSDKKSYLFAALAILAWSSVSTAFKLSLNHLTPEGLLLVSALCASTFLILFRVIAKVKSKYSFKENLKKSLLPALLNPFIYYLVLFEAYNRLRAQEAQALNYTWAIVLAILSVIILKEGFRIRDLGALLLSFIGVIIISTKGRVWDWEFDDIVGTALAAGSSLIWATYWILNMRDEREVIDKLFYNFALGSLAVIVYILLRRLPLFVAEAQVLKGILGGLYVGIFEMGLTFILWMKALEYAQSTARVANMIFLTPFVSLLFIQFALGESVQLATVIGLSLIVLSNILQKMK